MSGSGTTLVEACLLGRTARGADIDPLARLISKAKATPVDLAAFDKSAAEVTRLLKETRLDDRWRPELTDCDRWFLPEAAADLARLRQAILLAGGDVDVADLLWLCFSSLIVARTSVANARDLVHSRHHYRAWEQNPGCVDRFLTRMARARRMMAEYKDRLSANNVRYPDAGILGGDARSLDTAQLTLFSHHPLTARPRLHQGAYIRGGLAGRRARDDQDADRPSRSGLGQARVMTEVSSGRGRGGRLQRMADRLP